jgi:hypothetical protein
MKKEIKNEIKQLMQIMNHPHTILLVVSQVSVLSPTFVV